ncbi:hypothetical protein PHYPSEUDO_006344 [Phytophthora pseudosyringae]|uniref:Uncharacterized protein n=1 Tax=Phytophthora pseudosyringae TaxID=221518 RepID=A0A8T1VLT9_9STRA|nr:hypothetical protein PHYPSEUDO_006344 [Phytophthora pseudosyringae]
MVVSVVGVGVVVATSVDVSSLDLVGVFAPLLGEIMMLATTQKMVALRLVPVLNVMVAVQVDGSLLDLAEVFVMLSLVEVVVVAKIVVDGNALRLVSKQRDSDSID